MRLHSLIISVSQNVPAVTLGYDEKIHGFMEMMELGNYVSSPGNLPSATIEALDKRDDLREIIYERCFDSKAKIIEEAKKISELL
jgi:polysaccharide pyruvyl transferase WcaK-like protein